jgi:hypothetical protein
MSLETDQKVILPPKKNYIPQFLKQRDINSYSFLGRFDSFQDSSDLLKGWLTEGKASLKEERKRVERFLWEKRDGTEGKASLTEERRRVCDLRESGKATMP